jgi:bifunctional DNA-binding transcriptional regulator/antitoxin component of YhaV-PrlF toxin-antitoxin module
MRPEYILRPLRLSTVMIMVFRQDRIVMIHYLTSSLHHLIILVEEAMLCKRTYKNQITIPKKVMEKFDGVEYFEARIREGTIVLEPVEVKPLEKSRLAKVRKKIAALGLTERDIEDAVVWARSRQE